MDSLYEAIPEIEANPEKYQVIPLHSVLSDGQNKKFSLNFLITNAIIIDYFKLHRKFEKL